MFKLAMSLGLAVLSVLVISFAGLMSEARIGTILLRDLLGFFVAGALVYLVMFLLEAKDIALFDKALELASEEGLEQEIDESGVDGENAETGTEDGTGEGPAGFTPLTEQDFGHVETPQA